MIVGSSNDYCGVYDDGDDADGAPIADRADLDRLLPLARTAARRSLLARPRLPATRRRTRRARSCARRARAIPCWPGTATGACSRAPRPPRTRPARRRASATRASRRSRTRPASTRRRHTRDGLEFKRTVVVAKGSSAPAPGGKFNDKTAIEADRTGGACDGNVYFAYSRFTGSSRATSTSPARRTTA